MIPSKTILVSTSIILALAMILAPSVLSGNVFAKQKYKNWDDCRDDHSKNWCKNYFKKHHDNHNKNGGNKASQGIGQSQSSSQNSQCVSGGSTQWILQQHKFPKPTEQWKQCISTRWSRERRQQSFTRNRSVTIFKTK